MRLPEAKIERDPNSGCWLWTGSLGGGDYGVVHTKNGCQKAHRVAWQLRHGPIPRGMRVLHRCDTPICVNPDHLFLGTQADNVADMVAKGRHKPPKPQLGSINPQAVLTEAQARWVKMAVKESGHSQREIARMLGVSPMTVSRIVNNQTWSHVHAQ